MSIWLVCVLHQYYMSIWLICVLHQYHTCQFDWSVHYTSITHVNVAGLCTAPVNVSDMWCPACVLQPVTVSDMWWSACVLQPVTVSDMWWPACVLHQLLYQTCSDWPAGQWHQGHCYWHLQPEKCGKVWHWHRTGLTMLQVLPQSDEVSMRQLLWPRLQAVGSYRLLSPSTHCRSRCQYRGPCILNSVLNYHTFLW